MKKRHHVKYPGVWFLLGKLPRTNKEDKIFYIDYRREGKRIEEKAGRESQGMTAARANRIRARRMAGREPSNKERRELEKAKKQAKKDKWTISRLWEEYKQVKKIKGIVTDENRFQNHVKPTLGNKQPKDLVPLDIDRVRVKLSKTKAPSTTNHVLELVRRIINFGVRRQLIPPLGFKIELPAAHDLKTEDLNPDQIKRLLKVIDQDPHPQAGAIMKMALYTGMRRGELFKLQWQDIDFDRGFINIRGPKGGSDQVIPLNDAAREVLRSHPRAGDSPFVFPGKGGRKRTDINKAVRKIADAAGLPKDFRPLQGLRHVFASTLASSGEVDLYVLQRLLTHKSPMMSQRYAHLRDQALSQASNVMVSEVTKITEKKPSKEEVEAK